MGQFDVLECIKQLSDNGKVWVSSLEVQQQLNVSLASIINLSRKLVKYNFIINRTIGKGVFSKSEYKYLRGLK